ncbi:MAG: hypothetical protein U0X20_11800 [Caldilineaceae bacterium]
MFNSKRILSVVVHDSDGQRVFWATRMSEYYRQVRAQGLPETGTVSTFDRDGKAQTYTIAQWQDALQDEGEAQAEADAMSTPEPDEPDGPRDLEEEANYVKLQAYQAQEDERFWALADELAQKGLLF